MNRNTKSLPTLSTLALCILSAFLLPACSSGGGGSATVRADPSPPPPPPPPPPPGLRSLLLPPAPVAEAVPQAPAFNASDNVVRLVATGVGELLEPTTTKGTLTKLGGGELGLAVGDRFRFEGGTFVDEGTLILRYNQLFSDVTIASGATVEMTGDIIGDVDNRGILDPTEPEYPGYYDEYYDGHIFGDYRQFPEATLRVWLGLQFLAPATPLLTVSGTATLSGTLEVIPYYTITSGYLEWIVHAGGGVVGQFDRWSTPAGNPFFITGELHYGPDDVYLLTSRISTQSVMAAAGVADALTLGTAGTVDAAFDVADTFASLPSDALTQAQRQFLQSAAAIQQLHDYAQALTTFDSLSGHGQFAAVDALLEQALSSGPQSSAHIGSLQSGAPAGLWSAQLAVVPAGSGAFISARSAGYDHWLGDHVVFGSSFGWTQGNLQFERSGGTAYSHAPQWNTYLRRNGDSGAYLMGEVGYSRQQLSLERPIELGSSRGIARSERAVDVANAYLESGRTIRVGSGQLTPFAALGYAALNSEAFTEQGSTGFELIGQSSLHHRANGDVGLRYERNWYWQGDQRLRLNLGARFQHFLFTSDDMRAAFTGTPGVEFDLIGSPRKNDIGWLEMSLVGTSNDRLSWAFNYADGAGRQALSIGLKYQSR